MIQMNQISYIIITLFMYKIDFTLYSQSCNYSKHQMLVLSGKLPEPPLTMLSMMITKRPYMMMKKTLLKLLAIVINVLCSR